MSTTPPPSPAPVPAAASREPDDEHPRYNLGSGVYGLITVSVLIAAESAARETYGETVGAVALALLLYWLAHSYSELTGRRIRSGERLTSAGVKRVMRSELPILAGAAPPLVALLIVWAAGAALRTAIVIALWTAAVAILATEVAAGVQSDLSGRELLIQALVGTSLGVLVLVLRLVLH